MNSPLSAPVGALPNSDANARIETEFPRVSVRVLEKIAAIAIIALSLTLALVWLVRVPFFQQPDENAHADYAFALFSTGHLVRALNRKPATDLDPVVRYLEDKTGFRTMRYNPDGRAPAGYGSAAFYRAVDAGAPHAPRDFLAHDGRIPYVAQDYSYLYYALDAVAIAAGAWLSHSGAVAEFFAARGFNLILLALSLRLTYATLRELHYKPRAALALLAIIAFFPLTSWVSAYVQPDNLAFTAVAFAFYVCVRARREEGQLVAAAWLGSALGLLALTKADYLVAVAVPALCDRVLRFARTRPNAFAWIAGTVLVLLPPILLSASVRAIGHGAADAVADFVGANGNPTLAAAHQGLSALASYLGTQVGNGWNALFYEGISFVSYWGATSWIGTRFSFGSPEITDLVFAVVGALSQIVAALVVFRFLFVVWPRLGRVWRARGAGTAMRLLASDVLLNSYLLFAPIMLAIYVSTAGHMGTQGRYWLPLILPSVLCATRYAPGALRPALGRRVAVAFGGMLLAYSLVASVAGLATMNTRFYQPPAALHEEESLAHFTRIGPYTVTTLFALDDGRTFAPGARVSIEGWAFDAHNGLPARGVALAIDGKRYANLMYGLPYWEAKARYHDDGLLDTGFSGQIPLAGLVPGRHVLSLEIAESDRAAPHPSRAHVAFTIEPRR